MSEADSKTIENFQESKKTICANCMHPEQGSTYPHCYGTDQRTVDDHVNGGEKTEYYNPKYGKFTGYAPRCEEINDGNCPYYAEKPQEPEKPSLLRRIFKRGKDM